MIVYHTSSQSVKRKREVDEWYWYCVWYSGLLDAYEVTEVL